MRSLIDILNTGDLRHLLIEWDEDCEVAALIPVFDGIMAEYEELTGTSKYQEHFDKIDHALFEQLQLKVIEFIVECIEWGRFELASKIITEYSLIKGFKGITKDTIIKLTAKYKSIKNRIKVRNLKQDEKEDIKVVWEDKITFIMRTLNITPSYDCSVAQYVSFEKAANKIIQSRNEKENKKAQ